MTNIAYGILWILTRAIGRIWFRYRVQGAVPDTGGVLVAANHASYLDIPLLGCGMRRRAWYLGRSDLFPVPGLSGILRSLGWIPVRMGRLDREAFGKAISLIRAGEVVVIFPEGGRSRDGVLQPPKAGIGVIVSKTGCPVVPAYLKGTFDVLPTGAKWPRGRQVTVSFGEPIRFDPVDRKEKTETKRFYEQVSHTIIDHIAALGEVPSPLEKDTSAQDASDGSTAETRKAE
ncbi:MAG: 1-acyl-sn-glycerol-3-phosphate acyltransferase [Nitrospira sp.]|nr:1-acyl-sn-glycerol-3-phosphate acyltransferase [Nitrospira sp.]